MKTTIEISDPLLQDAKTVAAEQGLTLRALVEEGLRLALERRRDQQRFQMRHVTFRGDGLQPELADGSWEKVRDALYEGHGARARDCR